MIPAHVREQIDRELDTCESIVLIRKPDGTDWCWHSHETDFDEQEKMVLHGLKHIVLHRAAKEALDR